jgi:tetratricopeptide (TPR) repeat protein
MNSKGQRAECREQSTEMKGQRAIGKELRVGCPKLYDLCYMLLARCSMFLAISSIFLALSLYACSLPRIVVLNDPLSPEEHLNLGVTYEKKGELDNALKEYKEASKKLPLAYLYMGNVYYQKKEYDKAEFHYKEAIEKDPANADAYNNLAWLYFIKRENLDEAEKLVLKALELNPSKKEIYMDTLEKIKGLK